MGVSRDGPIFSGTPYYLRNGESYGFQILHAHLWAQSEQKPSKNSGKVAKGVVRVQGLLKIFRAPIHRAHRAVIFAIAQLSSLFLALWFLTFYDFKKTKIIISVICKIVYGGGLLTFRIFGMKP